MMYSIDVSSEKASKKLPTITTSSATPPLKTLSFHESLSHSMEAIPAEIPAEMLLKDCSNTSQNA